MRNAGSGQCSLRRRTSRFPQPLQFDVYPRSMHIALTFRQDKHLRLPHLAELAPELLWETVTSGFLIYNTFPFFLAQTDICVYHESHLNFIASLSCPVLLFLTLQPCTLLGFQIHFTPFSIIPSRNNGYGQHVRRWRWTRRSGTISSRAMVLRDADLHTILDQRDNNYVNISTMPYHHTLPTLLQLQSCICQEPGVTLPPLRLHNSLFQGIRSILHSTDERPSQYWRLITTFLYFGPLSLDLLFHVFFLQRYSRLLEESSGRSPAHFSWLLLYATAFILCLSPLLSIPFLGSALSSSLVYIWSRRNPDTRLSFLGLLVFTAPYLPWVLMLFSLVLHGTVPKDEICGVIVGHSMSSSLLTSHLFASNLSS